MSWEQLHSILVQAREQAAIDAALPPTACPNDGTPLQEGPNGVLYCPHDGWKA